MIDYETIVREYEFAIKECASKIPKYKWKHTPTAIKLTSRKRSYGVANIYGEILINKSYIGTNDIAHLRDTIRHEVAHLVVGIDEGHNRYFKRICRFLGGSPDSTSYSKEVNANITHKWKLLMHMENGDVLTKLVHRRSKAYTEYKPSWKCYRHVNGIKIIRFEYVINR